MGNVSWARRERVVGSILFLLAPIGLWACASDGESATEMSAGNEHEAGAHEGSHEGQSAMAVPSPLPPLGAIWGTAADDVWAVGEAGVILHYDGAAWSASASESTSALLGVHGSGRDDVWAVGDEIVLHWDGEAWTPLLQNMPEALLAVWAVAPDDVWIAGIDKDSHRGVLRHWNGEKFVRGVFGTAASVWELWGASASDVWMAGASTEVNGGFVARGNVDGVSPTDFIGTSLRGVWGLDDHDIWFLPYEGPFQHWDGETFSEYEGEPDSKLLGISGTAPDDVWAVGLHGVILHWDGSAWTRTPTDDDATLWSVWAAHPDDAWAVGGALMHWNGERWETMALAVPKPSSDSGH